MPELKKDSENKLRKENRKINQKKTMSQRSTGIWKQKIQ